MVSGRPWLLLEHPPPTPRHTQPAPRKPCASDGQAMPLKPSSPGLPSTPLPSALPPLPSRLPQPSIPRSKTFPGLITVPNSEPSSLVLSALSQHTWHWASRCLPEVPLSFLPRGRAVQPFFLRRRDQGREWGGEKSRRRKGRKCLCDQQKGQLRLK